MSHSSAYLMILRNDRVLAKKISNSVSTEGNPLDQARQSLSWAALSALEAIKAAKNGSGLHGAVCE